ncbi:MAG: hypothetical protein ACYCTB_09475 [bacterium]
MKEEKIKTLKPIIVSIEELFNDGFINNANLMRLNVFLPFNKIKNTNIYKEFLKNDSRILIKSKDFSVEIRNRLLTQIHRDVVDILIDLRRAKAAKKKNNNFTLVITFSKYEILKRLGYKKLGKQSYKWLDKTLEELTDVKFTVSIKAEGWTTAGMLEKVQYSKKQKKYMAVFTTDFIRYIDKFDNIFVNYSYFLDDIIKIKSPETKAFIRYVISNEFKRDKFKNILNELGINIISVGLRQYQKIKKEIKSYTDILNKIGIKINDDDNVLYAKHQKIITKNIGDSLPYLSDTELENQKSQQ